MRISDWSSDVCSSDLALDTLWISLMLAFSFGFYGLLRKIAPVGALPGLAVETTLLFIPGLAIAIYYGAAGDGVGFGAAPGISWLLVSAGAVTAVPLLLFATAARRMSYAALGFCPYLTQIGR